MIVAPELGVDATPSNRIAEGAITAIYRHRPVAPVGHREAVTMSSLATQAAETLQTAHLKRNPDPKRDVNPSTASAQRVPASIDYDSDEDAFAIRKRPAKHFPPIPDLRFEQSYLNSISKAETWWQVLFITVKDQVSSPARSNMAGCPSLIHPPGRVPSASGVPLEHHALRVAGLESEC